MDAVLLQNVMKREAPRTVYGDGPGKPAWRAEIAGNIRVLQTHRDERGITCVVGYNPDSAPARVRALIVAEGGGTAAGNPAIHAGPADRVVWDDDVRGQGPSQAKSTYALPEAFNQEGNQFVRNSMRLMQTHFGRMLESGMRSLPDAVFYSKVRSKG